MLFRNQRNIESFSALAGCECACVRALPSRVPFVKPNNAPDIADKRQHYSLARYLYLLGRYIGSCLAHDYTY